MNYTKLLATAAVLTVLATAPARAEDAGKPGMMDNVKVGFSQAIKDIQTWFGNDTPDSIEPAAGETGFEVTSDDALQVPPPVDPSMIEPAAGAGMDDDTLQVPPPYMGTPTSNTNVGTPRASAFDANNTTAFGDHMQSPEDIAGIAPAAGEGQAPAIDCAAITAAKENGEEVDAALIEQCANPAPAADTAAAAPEVKKELAPAQPALEVTPIENVPVDTTTPTEPASTPSVAPTPVTPGELPATQPATGE